MAITLDKDVRAAAVASIERWCREHLDEPIGNVTASGLLGFVLEEIGPNGLVLEYAGRRFFRPR